jgi:hypothetical protein
MPSWPRRPPGWAACPPRATTFATKARASWSSRATWRWTPLSPTGGRPLFTGFWRDTHPFEPEVERFLASVRFGSASVLAPAPVPEPAHASALALGGIEGLWRIDANGHVGTLTVVGTGSGWAVTLDLAGSPEALTGVGFDGEEVRFVRPLGAFTQAYVGRLVPGATPPRLDGVFDQGGAGAYPWRAERVGDVAHVPAAADADAIDTDAAVPRADPIPLLVGGWRSDANGHPGTLTFGWTEAGWVGVLNRQEGPEDLIDIAFDGAELRFVRPLGAYTQSYVGRLELDGPTWRWSGTFDQGGAGAYPWRAERPVDPQRLLAGVWSVDLAGNGGRIAFEAGAEGWIGTLTLSGGEPERLTDVTFDGAEIGFVRPLAEHAQVYWGVLDRDAATARFHGRFGYGAVGSYGWRAERIVGPGE